jgi:hypothetical protein
MGSEILFVYFIKKSGTECKNKCDKCDKKEQDSHFRKRVTL